MVLGDSARHRGALADQIPDTQPGVGYVAEDGTATTVTVISKNDHHVLSSHHIDPDRNYWRNQTKNPGRWPGNL
jgi:hypothetical protein